MTALHSIAKAAFALLLCAAVLVWSVVPTTSHVPKVLDVLQEHSEMIAEHGHSHGLEEDLLWATHGHNHDSADHDHNQAVVIAPDPAVHPLEFYQAAWQLRSTFANPLMTHLIERPPRL
ncbi:hypothetical protein [Roseovarius sp. MBR-6]|jgi:hypothetical protein|uniref:hypothetical protein n=1 Tax=Roseovarius sp. MBR-6 TaxID=3156459 RepID=UPI00339A4CB2